MTDKAVASPCNSICSLNDEDICQGCFRTADEIRRWSVLDNDQKLDVLIACGERNRKVNPFY
jgi:predicted Fe-S protein YdhL (DUF1289 family)